MRGMRMPETPEETVVRLQLENQALRAENKRLRDNWNIIGKQVRDSKEVFEKLNEFMKAIGDIAWYREDENV